MTSLAAVTAPPEYRVLVTGSSDWRDAKAIWVRLDAFLFFCRVTSRRLVVVHGDCATGADRIAARWCARAIKTHGARWVRAEAHPADWDGPCRPGCKPGHRRRRNGTLYCPAAGNYRNGEMTRLGAARCLAFARPCRRRGCTRWAQPHCSHGTFDCITQARRAGIPVTPALHESLNGQLVPRREEASNVVPLFGAVP